MCHDEIGLCAINMLTIIGSNFEQNFESSYEHLKKKYSLWPFTIAYWISTLILKLEMALCAICTCWLDETISDPYQKPKLSMELEVPTRWPRMALKSHTKTNLSHKMGEEWNSRIPKPDGRSRKPALVCTSSISCVAPFLLCQEGCVLTESIAIFKSALEE